MVESQCVWDEQELGRIWHEKRADTEYQDRMACENGASTCSSGIRPWLDQLKKYCNGPLLWLAIATIVPNHFDFNLWETGMTSMKAFPSLYEQLPIEVSPALACAIFLFMVGLPLAAVDLAARWMCLWKEFLRLRKTSTLSVINGCRHAVSGNRSQRRSRASRDRARHALYFIMLLMNPTDAISLAMKDEVEQNEFQRALTEPLSMTSICPFENYSPFLEPFFLLDELGFCSIFNPGVDEMQPSLSPGHFQQNHVPTNITIETLQDVHLNYCMTTQMHTHEMDHSCVEHELVSFMQQSFRQYFPSSRECELHNDARVQRDHDEIWAQIGPASTTGQLWTTQVIAPPGMQMSNRIFRLDTTRCIRCSITNQRQNDFPVRMYGPYLIRPTPVDSEPLWARQFIVLDSLKPMRMLALLVHYNNNDVIHRGTILVNHFNGQVDMNVLFTTAKPLHRCTQTAWCRVRFYESQTWWPDPVMLHDFSLVYLDEIDPPVEQETSSSDAMTTCLNTDAASIQQTSSESTSEISSNFADMSTSLLQMSTVLFTGTTAAASIIDTPELRDFRLYINQLEAEEQIAAQEHDQHPPTIISVTWLRLQRETALQQPQVGDVIRFFRYCAERTDRRATFLRRIDADLLPSQLITEIESFWNDLGPFLQPFNFWKVQEVHRSILSSCAQSQVTTNYVMLTEIDKTLPGDDSISYLLELQRYFTPHHSECFLQVSKRRPRTFGFQIIAELRMTNHCALHQCFLRHNTRIWPKEEDRFLESGDYVVLLVSTRTLRNQQNSFQRNPSMSPLPIDMGMSAPRELQLQVLCLSPRLSSHGLQQRNFPMSPGYTIAALRIPILQAWPLLGGAYLWAPMKVNDAYKSSPHLVKFESLFVIWEFRRVHPGTNRKVIAIETQFAAQPPLSASEVSAYVVDRPLHVIELLMSTQTLRLCTAMPYYKCEIWYNGVRVEVSATINSEHGDFCKIVLIRENKLAAYGIGLLQPGDCRIPHPAEFNSDIPNFFAARDHLLRLQRRLCEESESRTSRTCFWLDPVRGLRPPGNGPIRWISHDFDCMDEICRLGPLVLVTDYHHQPCRVSLSEMLGCTDSRPPVSKNPRPAVSLYDSLEIDDCIDPLPPQNTSSFSIPLSPEQLLQFTHAWRQIELETSFQDIFDELHVSAQQALNGTNCYQDDWNVLREVHLYVDGSFSHDQGIATWAFVALGMKEELNDLYLLGCSRGSVVTDQDDENWIGANGLSAFVAEQTALCMAGWFALSLSPSINLFFGYDNVAAAKMAIGEWTQNRAHQVVSLTRAIFQLIETRMQDEARLTTKHVLAHSNHPWNELADSLAKNALKKQCVSPRLNFDIRPWITGRLPLVEHLAFFWRLYQDDSEYPAVHEQEVSWPRWRNAEMKTPAFVLKNSPGEEDTKEFTLFLRIMSYNVCSLQDEIHSAEEPWKSEYLRDQAEWKEVHIVALQETRARQDLFIETPNYWRYISASDKGQAGTELWFSRNIFIGKHQRFTKNMFQVVFKHPRLLAVTVDSTWLRALVISCHAPHSTRPDYEKDSWWKMVNDCVMRYASDRQLFCLGDFNVQINEVVHTVIGMNLDEQTNYNGILATKHWNDWGLFAPSTFPDCQWGPYGTWYSSRSKKWKRLDHILLPYALFGANVQTWVDEDFHAGQLHLDHRAIMATLTFASTQSKPKRSKDISRSAIRDPANRARIQETFKSLALPEWKRDVHCHYDDLTLQLHQALAQEFPQMTKEPRKSYISENSWQLWKYRTLLKRRNSEYNRRRRIELLRFVIHVWHGQPTAVAEDSPPIDLVEACRIKLDFENVGAALRRQLATDRNLHFEKMSQQVDQVPQAQLYQSLRALGIGARRKKKGLTTLPMLANDDGVLADTFSEAQRLWMEFAKELEFGDYTNHHELWWRCVRQYMRHSETKIDLEWFHFPSQQRLEQLAHKVKYGKATGPDQVISEVLHLFPSETARMLHPLLIKTFCHQAEPVSAKGGLLIRAFKGKGDSTAPASHRGLLISNHLAKILHAAIREPLLPTFSAHALPMQLGGRRKCTVAAASHIVRLFQSWAKYQKWTTGVLFLDIQTAFYRILRPLIARHGTFHAQLSAIIDRFGLDASTYQEVCKALDETSVLTDLDVPPIWEAMLAELHTNTWFSTASRQELVRTQGGTRPGSPCADIVFSFLFLKVITGIRQQLYADGLLIEVDWTGSKSLFPRVMPNATELTLFETIWADDLAVMFASPDASQIVVKAERIATLIVDGCMRYGLKPNFGKGKTELMLVVRGKNSVKTRRQLFENSHPQIKLHVQSLPDCHLSIITKYTHLGGHLTIAANDKHEMFCRLAQARSVFNKYRRRLFQCASVAFETRVRLFQPFVLSILQFGIGTWTLLTESDVRKAEVRLIRLYKALLRPRFPHDQINQMTNDETIARVQLPPFHVLLHIGRLRHFSQLLTAGPPILWAMRLWLRTKRPGWISANCPLTGSMINWVLQSTSLIQESSGQHGRSAFWTPLGDGKDSWRELSCIQYIRLDWIGLCDTGIRCYLNWLLMLGLKHLGGARLKSARPRYIFVLHAKHASLHAPHGQCTHSESMPELLSWDILPTMQYVITAVKPIGLRWD